MQEEKRFDVSVYLIKDSQVSAAKSELFPPATDVRTLTNIPGGEFLALSVDAAPPSWLDFIRPLITNGDDIDVRTQTPGGILWIPRASKQYVFTFGYAHMKLKDEWVEPEFGKKVALSVIPQGQVIEVRAEQVFAKWHIANERAPRASAVREFGFEADRDLVSSVEGVPSAAYIASFGKRVRGGTAFKFGMRFSKLLEALDILSERFDSADYQKMWPQVDNLVVVRDATVIASLDKVLDALLSGPNPAERLALAAPAFRSGDKPYPQHFAIGRLSNPPVSAPYLLFGNWAAYLRHKKGKPSLDASLETKVHLLDENKDEIDSCSMYQCFGAEVSMNGRPYILSSGVWYQAKRKFVTETNQLILSLEAPSHALPLWNQIDDEGTYNERAASVDTSLWLFDKKLVYFGGGHSSFEFCDLMHLKTKALYFVKQPGASASVSHLCEQVRRTVENFFSTDDEFRKKLAASITKHGAKKNMAWLASRPLRQDWNLCLVSMGKPASKFPFFAKCGVARLVRELQQGGYNVSFAHV